MDPIGAAEIEHALLGLAGSPWIYGALFVLVVADAFLVVLPSETLVVALGALAASGGQPSMWLLIPVAALGALVGDALCYLIGTRIGTDRWAWQRQGRIATALARARATVLTRPAVLIFTARYIPYARIAVNLSAGAAGLPAHRFLPLAAAAGTAWAIYNTTVGAIFGTALPDSPVLAIALSVAVAVAVGLLVDWVVRALASRGAARKPPGAGTDPA
jgi:membrane protein DedA with SNARE-associated domain